jgi:peptidoglycan/xylan/chitin deacetylase (PgdA/CDA1 family)
MSLADRVRDAWRKNSPELLGLFNGSLPACVRRAGRGGELDGIPVFSYHVVAAERLALDLTFLERNGYTALRLDELLDCVAGRRPFTGRQVVLTFDDGPRNFHDVALPLLLRFGMAATAFVAPGLHAEHYGELQDLRYRPMTWHELRAVRDSGLVAVESHTLQSQYVPAWPRAAPLAGVDPRIEQRLRRPPLSMQEDFAAARELLESELPGTRVRHLCYPMYHATDEARRAATAAGYVAGYGGLLPGRGLVREGDDVGLLPRMSWEFLRRLPGDGRATAAELLRCRLEDGRRARAREREYGTAA